MELDTELRKISDLLPGARRRRRSSCDQHAPRLDAIGQQTVAFFEVTRQSSYNSLVHFTRADRSSGNARLKTQRITECLFRDHSRAQQLLRQFGIVRSAPL